ncbi:LysM peptidoglycan-binding domain-containing protein [Nostoc sp. PCC 7120 = FACHB-418]|uniref:LysM domain-containing protein n=3 Tax=Nostocales TaxID=1161 RepID=A0A1Z4KJN7_ANAVA|nr:MULTISPECIES: LysM peptidoglycan-binding domain-containing protein [Nostocaceae]MBD2174289.1 LysM peptidoglycan-binding domain-containing protein [Anabaena cylindrica FACHB-318]MBD2286686.1 LysM peptidoglycan-binding domain-containing protein [Anabaena cylindrica FACHB-170]MBD2351829.1 LysM peptidoglycan-binding domain-containing protein [Trichormus variabilis FACHB-171]BAY69114.1 hypothetical protein NIES23_19050 [Trichormus variabilis NIES-23]HBW32970.1 hypothetical protein [Nostoc sp. UB
MREYLVQKDDTLFKIAQKHYGDGNLYPIIHEANRDRIGNNPDQLTIGMTLLIPEIDPIPLHLGSTKKGNVHSMLEALGAFESGVPSGNPQQYQVENSLGFIGKYQFGEALLMDLGYYNTSNPYIGGANGVNRNYWNGTWTGKMGIRSKSDFLKSTTVQETAIREAFKLNLERINQHFATHGQSLENYLGKQALFNSRTITITLSGILAAAHLRGPYGLADLLLKNQVSYDEYGTSILKYLEEYGGYDVSLADFS